MKYFSKFDRNVVTILHLQWKIGNISDMFLQYSVLCGLVYKYGYKRFWHLPRLPGESEYRLRPKALELYVYEYESQAVHELSEWVHDSDQEHHVRRCTHEWSCEGLRSLRIFKKSIFVLTFSKVYHFKNVPSKFHRNGSIFNDFNRIEF